MRRSHIQTVVPMSLIAAVLAGCIGQPVATPTPSPTPSPTAKGVPAGATGGLETLAQQPPPNRPGDAELERRILEQARRIEQLETEKAALAVKQAALAKPPAPVKPAPVPVPAPTPIPAAESGLAALGGVDTGEPAPAATPAATSEDKPNLAPITAPLTERFNAAADELAKTLRERAAASTTPAAEYAMLAWLDTIRPGVLASLDTGPAAHVLDPRQKKSINVTREMLLRVSTDPKLLNDPDQLWRAFSDAATPITQMRDMRLANTELCTKVDGFGQYEILGTRTLTAGVSHSLIVYAELDSFSYRKTVEEQGERYTVDVGQAVEVWQDSDRPTLQKRWGETTIKDVSRRQRKDFYITAVIELPPNLTVGAYNLKVIVRDHLRGATAEKSLPFVIAADASVATAGN